MSTSWRPLSGVDPTKPNVARTYDYWLGGTHNFVADRELGERMETLDPCVPAAARANRANRAFLGRAVRFLAAECGIRQFLDLGSGIPTAGSVHEVAQQAAPGSRVVYVDHDAAAVALSRDLLAGNDLAGVIQADVRRPEEILRHPRTRGLIDLTEPVAILFVAILHFVLDSENPYRIVGRYRDAVPPGSYLVISHVTSQNSPQLASSIRRLYTDRAADELARSREEIARLFGGWALVEPGLRYAPEWRPDAHGDTLAHPERLWFLVGVARKPGRSDGGPA